MKKPSDVFHVRAPDTFFGHRYSVFTTRRRSWQQFR